MKVFNNRPDDGVYQAKTSALKELVHSVQQKSISLKFSKSRTGSHVMYSCHQNSSRFIFPIISSFVAFLCIPFMVEKGG